MNLNTFYQSQEWRRLLDVLKTERVDEHGDIRCAYCGEPIVRAYDCIGHHTVLLDDSNVADADVSLNPQLIQLVHHRCHNRIHDKLGYREDLRKVYLVYGAPLSGKSAWVDEVKSKGDLIVDVDSIWECISGCDRYIKPNQLTGCVFRIRDCMIEQVQHRIGKWRTAYIIGGYPLTGERERLCKALGAEEIFVSCDKEECLRRLKESGCGRDIAEWTGYIEDWFRKYHPPLPS